MVSMFGMSYVLEELYLGCYYNFFFITFFFCLTFLSVDLQSFINFSILIKSDLNFSLSLVFDHISLMFIFTVLLVSLLVMFYSLDYMKD